jgi:anti-anti-sigma regulatory factor
MHSPVRGTEKPATLFVDFSIEQSALLITPVGPNVGSREVSIIAQAVRRHLAAIPSHITALVFDFNRVKFLNSMGLGMLIEIRGEAHRLHLGTGMVNVSDELTTIIKSMKINRLIPICNTARKLQRLMAA